MKQRLRAVLANSGQGDCYYIALSQHRLLKEYGHLHVRYTADMLHFVWEPAGKARMPGPRYENIDLYESEICMHPWAQAAKQQKNGQWDFAVLYSLYSRLALLSREGVCYAILLPGIRRSLAHSHLLCLPLPVSFLRREAPKKKSR